MNERTKVLLFAGTHAQAVDWRRAHGYSQQEAEYVHGAETLRGRATKSVPRVFTGTFWQRIDADDIQTALLIADMNERTQQ